MELWNLIVTSMSNCTYIPCMGDLLHGVTAQTPVPSDLERQVDRSIFDPKALPDPPTGSPRASPSYAALWGGSGGGQGSLWL